MKYYNHVSKEFRPIVPPGYVFVTNNGQTADKIITPVENMFDGIIPRDAFITLDNVGMTPSSTFVEEQYASIISAWHERIYQLLKSLLEHDKRISNE